MLRTCARTRAGSTKADRTRYEVAYTAGAKPRRTSPAPTRTRRHRRCTTHSRSPAALGAAPLRAEIEALARRARVRTHSASTGCVSDVDVAERSADPTAQNPRGALVLLCISQIDRHRGLPGGAFPAGPSRRGLPGGASGTAVQRASSTSAKRAHPTTNAPTCASATHAWITERTRVACPACAQSSVERAGADTATPDRLLGHRVCAHRGCGPPWRMLGGVSPGHAAVRQHVLDVIAAALASGIPEDSIDAELAAMVARTSSTDPPSTWTLNIARLAGTEDCAPCTVAGRWCDSKVASRPSGPICRSASVQPASCRSQGHAQSSPPPDHRRHSQADRVRAMWRARSRCGLRPAHRVPYLCRRCRLHRERWSPHARL